MAHQYFTTGMLYIPGQLERFFYHIALDDLIEDHHKKLAYLHQDFQEDLAREKDTFQRDIDSLRKVYGKEAQS